jgi:integrase
MAVLAECPVCHTKQKTKNKVCPCGEDLDAAKRSKKVRYWIMYRVPGGKQRKEYVGYSVQEAKDADGKRKGQKREGRIWDMLPGADTTFQELADWYLDLRSVKKLSSYRNIKSHLVAFLQEFGARSARSLKLEDLENYQDMREEAGLAPGTIDMELRLAQGVVKKAYYNDMVDDRGLKAFRKVNWKVKKGANARERTASVDEYLRILENASPHIEAMVTVAYNTGMRHGELKGLRWSHIDRKNWFFRLPAELTKERKPRNVPINKYVKEALTALPRPMHHDFLFTFKGEPITRQITYAFRRACERAGITYGMKAKGGLRFHDLRASFKTNMLEAGVDKALRDKLVGHSFEGMDRYYLRLKDDHLRGAMDLYTEWLDRQLAQTTQNVTQTVPQTTLNP